MFTNKPQAILIINRKGFELQTSIGINSRGSFDPTAFNNLEVIDKTKLATQINDFIKSEKIIPGQVAIILNDDLIFQKEISSQDTKTEETTVQAFLDEIPWDPKIVDHEVLQVGSKKIAFAANRQIHQAFIDALTPLGWEVIFVLSAFVVADLLGKENITRDSLTAADISHIFNLLAKVKKENLLLEEKKDNTLSENNNSLLTNRTRRWFIAGGLIVFLLLMWVGLLYFKGYFKVTKSKTSPSAVSTTISPSAVPTKVKEATTSAQESTPAATTKDFNKQDVKIQVLNGSGITGQAGNIKKTFLGLGYSQVTTGNAPNNTNETSLEYDKSIPVTALAEIKTELSKLFLDLVLTETANLAPFSLKVTTGKK